jgi:hypothetical protein
MDFKPNVNIPPFGKCRSLINPTVAAATAANEGRLKKMPCIPNVTMHWIFGKEDTLADGAPALLDCSMNMCVWCGKISIADDGQNVKSARPKDEERIKMGKEKLNDGGMMMLIGLGALLTGIAIVTLPLSIPTLLVGAGVSVAVATATGVTVGAGIAAVGATVMKTGGSEAFEGAQDVAYGNAGSDRSSFNPVRDIDFRGNQGAYDQAKGILTTVAAVGTILLAPVVEMNASSTVPNPGKTNATEQTAKAGNTAAGKFKLARGWGKSTTSALRLKSGKIDAVGQTKAAANAGTRANIKGAGKGNAGASEVSKVLNRKGNPYPKVEIEGYGEIPHPKGPYVPNNTKTLRPRFTEAYKKQFKEWWINQGRPWPKGEVNIHHIKPLSKGGDNSFQNLVPLVQPEQHQPFTNWWRSFP